MKKLNAESARAYLLNGGVHCPHCGSGDVTGDAIDLQQGCATQSIYCNECGGAWTDIYRLVAVRCDESEKEYDDDGEVTE